MNYGGSTKDRIGKRMLIEAEKEGKIKPGMRLIEASSGNTGVGITLAAAVKGYKLTITMPEKMSKEKSDLITALGANVIRCPSEKNYDD